MWDVSNELAEHHGIKYYENDESSCEEFVHVLGLSLHRLGINAWNESNLIPLHVIDLVVIIKKWGPENPHKIFLTYQGARTKFSTFEILLDQVLLSSCEVNVAVDLDFQAWNLILKIICAVVDVQLSWQRIVTVSIKVFVDEITYGCLNDVDILIVAHDHTCSVSKIAPLVEGVIFILSPNSILFIATTHQKLAWISWAVIDMVEELYDLSSNLPKVISAS